MRVMPRLRRRGVYFSFFTYFGPAYALPFLAMPAYDASEGYVYWEPPQHNWVFNGRAYQLLSARSPLRLPYMSPKWR